MKVEIGDTVTVTAATNNHADPPVSVQWKPQPGKTELTITLIDADGDTEAHAFHVNAVKP